MHTIRKKHPHKSEPCPLELRHQIIITRNSSMKFKDIFSHIFGTDQGDRLKCLQLEALFLDENAFAREVWKELRANLTNTRTRAAAKACFSQAEIRNALYEHYIATRPQLCGGFIAVSRDGPLWAIGHKDYVKPSSQAWHGWPEDFKKNGFEGLGVHRCTDRVLDEVVMKGPYAASAIVRVEGVPFDCYYHVSETRPTHSYQ
jgi:hypothetical protein